MCARASVGASNCVGGARRLARARARAHTSDADLSDTCERIVLVATIMDLPRRAPPLQRAPSADSDRGAAGAPLGSLASNERMDLTSNRAQSQVHMTWDEFGCSWCCCCCFAAAARAKQIDASAAGSARDRRQRKRLRAHRN